MTWNGSCEQLHRLAARILERTSERREQNGQMQEKKKDTTHSSFCNLLDPSGAITQKWSDQWFANINGQLRSQSVDLSKTRMSKQSRNTRKKNHERRMRTRLWRKRTEIEGEMKENRARSRTEIKLMIKKVGEIWWKIGAIIGPDREQWSSSAWLGSTLTRNYKERL